MCHRKRHWKCSCLLRTEWGSMVLGADKLRQGLPRSSSRSKKNSSWEKTERKRKRKFPSSRIVWLFHVTMADFQHCYNHDCHNDSSHWIPQHDNLVWTQSTSRKKTLAMIAWLTDWFISFLILWFTQEIIKSKGTKWSLQFFEKRLSF